MPDTPNPQDVAERLAAPVEELLSALGSGIGRSQAELDRYSIETQRRIDEDPVLAAHGLQATWYQIPSSELEIKVAFAMESQERSESTGGGVGAPAAGIPPRGLVAGRELSPRPRIWAQPVNPRLVNQFGFSMNAASTLRLTVAAVPPPGAAAAAQPQLSVDEALATADKHLRKEGDTAVGRVTVNFNAAMSTWYVVQSVEREGRVDLLALVKIDDGSGAVIEARTES